MNRFFKINTDNIETKKNLIYSIWDGILWALMFGFAESYLIPFALLYNANAIIVSLIHGSSFLANSLAQILGSFFFKKINKVKKIIVFCVRTHALFWILIFVVTVLTKKPIVIAFLFFLGVFATNFIAPSWLSWMNHLVPVNIRGEYWGLRNKLIGISQFIAISLAGLLLFIAKNSGLKLYAFGMLFFLAFLSRYSSSFFLNLIDEPEVIKNNSNIDNNFKALFKKLFFSNFGKFCLFSFSMTFAVNLMAPIISFYILKILKFNYLQFASLSMIMIISSFIFVTYWGKLSDKYGNYHILTVTAVSLPILAFGWVIIKSFYLLMILQIFSGFIWSGFNLCTINFIFDSIHKGNILKTSAYFNSINNFFAFTGTILGGIIALFTPKFNFSFFLSGNFELIFLLSSLLRLAIILIFMKQFKEVRIVENIPSYGYFYIYKPVTNMINKFQLLKKTKKK